MMNENSVTLIGLGLTFQTVLLVSSFAFLCLLYMLRRRSDNKDVSPAYKNLPGPGRHLFGALTNLLTLANHKTTLQVMESWGEKYGPIFQVNFGTLNVVALNSPQYIQKLLSSKDSGHLNKGFIYDPGMRFGIKEGLFLSNGEKWRKHRKLINKHMFAFGTLKNYMKTMSKEGDTLVNALASKVDKNGPIEHFLAESILNVVARVTFGKKFAGFEAPKGKWDLSFVAGMEEMKKIILKRLLYPWLLNNWLWRLHPMSKWEKIVAETLMNYTLNGLSQSGTSEDVDDDDDDEKLGIGIKQNLLDAGLSIEDIGAEALTLLLGGYDTVNFVLQMFLFLLALHPQHQKLCREAVDSVFEDTELVSSDGELGYGALAKLKYLEMCAYESLRLFPVGFFMMRNIQVPLELERGLELPAGTNCAIYSPGIHKNPEWFPDPHSFKPERWTGEENSRRHPYAFLGFNAGPRKCIGHKLAVMEMVCLTAKLLRNYELHTTDTMQDVVLLPYTFLTLEKPINFIIKKRTLS